MKFRSVNSRCNILAAVALVTTSGGLASGDDGVELSNVPEMMEMFAPGPNVGEERLPIPKPPAPPKEAPAEHAPVEAPARRLHLTLGVDFTNAYYSRGLRQEDRGVIAQPYATAGLDFYRSDTWNLQAYLGTWNSLHDRKTGSGTNDSTLENWYEADAYFGLTAEYESWTLGAQYGWFLSPNDAFTTVQELQFSASYDDADDMGAWALAPNATLVIETGDGTSDGLDKGAYLQFGIEPGYDFEQSTVESLRVSAPIIVGLSAWDYYEQAPGEDDLFGFFSVGCKCSIGLTSGEEWGELSAYAAVNLLVLGDYASQVNDDEDTEVVWSVGLAYSY
jgi:hypothetical protein